MKHLKHLFTALLLLCATVATAHDFEVGGIYYDITSTTDFTVEVTYKGYSSDSYSNEYSGNVVIPESVTYNGSTYSVTSIGDYAFFDCSGLTSVEIPNSVTSIGEGAFYNCSGLTSVVIPNSVTSIGDYAFYDCSGLTSVVIPNSVTSIGDYAFRDCSGLTSVVIPNSVTSIGDYAFQSCSGLTSVEIPNSVTSIGERAFSYCSGLTSVVIGNSVTSIGEDAFRDCSGLTSVVIGNSVTSIGDYAFYRCSSLTSVEIPNSVTSIGRYAFEYCTGLTNVVIPNSVTSIGSSAFYGTAWYNNQPDGVVYAGKVLYKYKGIMSSNTSIAIKDGTLGIVSSAFSYCSGLTSVVIPNSVTSIGERAFSGCSGLTSVEIPNSVTSIGAGAFDGTAWYNNQPDGVVYAGKVLYKYKGTMSSNTSIAIKDGTLGIGERAFYDCSGLTSVEIPNSVTSIGDYAFFGCSGLTSVEIPNSVTSIGDNAFDLCSGLKEVHISDLSAWCGIEFVDYSANPLYYADNLYLNGELVTDLVIPDGVTEIKDYAFYNCSGLTSVVIPNSVTSIGDYAFSYCSGLTSVEIPNSVTSIGERAFYKCSGLKKVINFSSLTFSKGSTDYGYVAYYAGTVVNAPDTSVEGDFVFAVIDGVNTLCLYVGAGGDVTLPADYNGENYVIGSYAFAYCTGLTSVVIPNSVTSIGSYAFSGCSGLTSVVIPNSVTSIGECAFRGCDGLKEVHISDLSAWCGIEFGDYYADSYSANPLYYAHNLYLNDELVTDLVIPNSVTNIGDDAFYGCSALTSVEIPNSVTRIGSYAFRDCSGLKKVINFSSLKFSKGSTDYGYVAYYAETVINAPNGSVEGDFVFGVINGVNTLCGYIGAGGDVTLPADYNGENYAIGADVFENNTSLTSIEIPNSVTSIGGYAFYNCSGLTSVEIPNSVTSIGSYAFSYCSGLASVVIPNSVTSIGSYAFRGCSGLTSVVIPNSVTSIGDYAFRDCTGLTSVVIPNSVTSIGDYAFRNCTGLTSVVIGNSVTSIGDYAFSYCSGLTSVVIGNSVTSIGEDAFSYCSALKKVINFSSLTFSKGSTSYGYVAYYADTVINACSVEGDFVFAVIDGVNTLCLYVGVGGDVTLPADYKGENYAIGADVFKNNTLLTSVVIPNSVTSIGDGAFSGCSGLKKVINFSSLTFSKGSTANGYVAYYADTVINVPNGSVEGDFVFGVIDGVNTLCAYIGAGGDVTLPADYNGENYVIGANVFKNNTLLTSIEFPNSVTSIGGAAFSGCSGLTSVVIPNSVISIGGDAFYGCSGLKEVHISDLSAWCGIKFGDDSANPLYYADNLYLNGELLTDLVIPDGVTEIKDYAFYNCSGLTSVVIPNSVTSIGDYAFSYCSSLTSVEIPNSVTSIGERAFYECSGLKEVHISDLSAWCGIDFESSSANPLYYAHNLYLNGELVTDLVIPDGVTEIKGYAFYGCSGLTNVVIPNSVTGIGSYAFYNCSGLTSVVIPNSVTGIGSYAFYNCSGLTSVVIPNSVTSIDWYAFQSCSALKKVINCSSLKFSKGSTANGYVAYYADTVINAPNGSVEGDFVFAVIDGVNTLCAYIGAGGDVTLPADYNGENYAIGADVFENNTSLTSVVIPNGVISIGNGAFRGCSGLTSVVIGNGVISIGDNAFQSCSGLKEVHISDLSAWCNIAFASADANPLYYAENLYLNDELLTELTIPDSVTEMKNFAFYNCSGLTSIEILDGVTGIGEEAFRGCSDLEYIYISNTIESIGDYAFAECNNIFDIKIGSKKVVAASENVFSSDAYNNACLYVPAGRKDFYAKTSPWSNFIIQEMDFTGIDEVKGENGKVEGVYYDLNGRAVERPANGLYIKNGKKVFVK